MWIANRGDRFLIVVLLIFLVVQSAAVIMYGDRYYLGDLTVMNDNDDVKYVRSALILIEEGTLKYKDEDISIDMPTVFIMPGYPAFLSLFIKGFGLEGGLLAVRLVQGFLMGGVMVLLYLIGIRYVNKGAACLTVVLYAFYIPTLGTALLILSEAVFTFLFVLLVYLCFRAIETKKMSYYISGGIVLGLAVLFKPAVLLFPGVVLILWLIKKYSVREMLVRTLAVACILAAILAPWWVRNAVEFGRFIPLTISSGNPFLQGTFIEYDQEAMLEFSKNIPDREGWDAIRIDENEMSLGKQNLNEIWSKDPLRVTAWYTAGKLKYLWGSFL
jgi:4-amino-4-deoxy-L-arabinose transferase-like glycosyltransferase